MSTEARPLHDVGTAMSARLAALSAPLTALGAHAARLDEVARAFAPPPGLAEAIRNLDTIARSTRSAFDNPTARAEVWHYGLARRGRRFRHHGRTAADVLGRVRIGDLDRLLAALYAGRTAIRAALDTETNAAAIALLTFALALLESLDDVARHERATVSALLDDTAPTLDDATHDPPPRVRCAHHRRHLAAVATASDDPAPARSSGALRPRFSTLPGGN